MKILPHRLDAYVRKTSRVILGENAVQGLKNLQIYLEKGIKNDPLSDKPEPASS